MILKELSRKQLNKVFRDRLVKDFPREEIRPLNMIHKALDKGIYECLGLFEDDNIIGYAFLIKLEKNYLLDYLAVYPDCRNSGVGRNMLRLLKDYLIDADNVILEVENPDFAEDEDDRSIKTRRLEFYLKNGCIDTGAKMTCFGVPFLILSLSNFQDMVDTNIETDHEGDADNLKVRHTELEELYVSFYRAVLPKILFERSIKYGN